MRTLENFEINVNSKKYEVIHSGIKSYKEQKDFMSILIEEIKRTSVPHVNVFGQKTEAKTDGFIQYNNFECSVEFKVKNEQA